MSINGIIAIIAAYVTIGGFIVTIIMLLMAMKSAGNAKTAAIEARNAAQEASSSARDTLKKKSLLVELPKCKMLCTVIEDLIRNSRNEAAIIRTGELMDKLIEAGQYDYFKTSEENKVALRGYHEEVRTIKEDLNELEERRAPEEIDRLRIFKILTGLNEGLTKWVEELKLEA